MGKLKERRPAVPRASCSASVGKVLKRGGGSKGQAGARADAAKAQGRSRTMVAATATPRRRDGAMTREQALSTLGLEPDATDARSTRPARTMQAPQNGLNGSDHAIAAKLDAAREILRGRGLKASALRHRTGSGCPLTRLALRPDDGERSHAGRRLHA